MDRDAIYGYLCAKYPSDCSKDWSNVDTRNLLEILFCRALEDSSLEGEPTEILEHRLRGALHNVIIRSIGNINTRALSTIDLIRIVRYYLKH